MLVTGNDLESRIVAQIRAGDVDHQTWQTFVDRLHSWICRRYPFLIYQAYELADESAMRILVSFRSYRGDATFHHWCYGIVRHVVSRHLRKTNGVTVLSLQDLEDEPSADEPLRHELLQWAAEAAVAKLTTLERHVFMSRIHYGTGHGEIARRLGISCNASHQTWSRAVKKMRQFAQENDW